MSKFSEPQEVSGLEMAFGGDMKKLLPLMCEIPEEFQRGRTEWNKLFSTWFFSGLKSFDSKPKDGIDKERAMRHVVAIMRSWEPKHEHKEAACAYLLSLWFKEPVFEAEGE